MLWNNLSLIHHLQEIYELVITKNGVSGSSIARHDTGTHAVMNSSSYYDGRNHHLATGQDEFCRTYSIKYKVVTPNKTATGEFILCNLQFVLSLWALAWSLLTVKYLNPMEDKSPYHT